MDKIGYRGEITIISTLRNGKKITKKYHNHGTPDLFKFLVNCLVRTEGVFGGAPRLIDVVSADSGDNAGKTILKSKRIIGARPVLETASSTSAENKWFAEFSAVITKSDLADNASGVQNVKLKLYDGSKESVLLAETDNAMANFLFGLSTQVAISAQIVWRMYFENVTTGGNS